ncbi:MAG TPA: hypothetical protein PL124_13090, partial [Candidatus Cloacimonadota bacterium]|nr:hypothetical protein [Candidatus Cloacimonadota bacterium]
AHSGRSGEGKVSRSLLPAIGFINPLYSYGAENAYLWQKFTYKIFNLISRMCKRLHYIIIEVIHDLMVGSDLNI